MNKTLTVGQILALNNTLTEYPMDLPFNQILNMIINESDEIVIWEPFEDMNPNELTIHIESLAEQIDKEIALALQ